MLRHARDETKARPVGALIYIGDAMEENPDDLAAMAGELGLLGVKAFMFQEGSDAGRAAAFREIARLTGGAYAAFDAGAPRRLAELLARGRGLCRRAARQELERRAGEGEAAARLLLSQIRVRKESHAHSCRISRPAPRRFRPQGLCEGAAGVFCARASSSAAGGFRWRWRRAAFLLSRAGASTLASRSPALASWLMGVGGASLRGFRQARAGAGGVSRVRSAMIEMELDHASGAMRGVILAGPNEGKQLDGP